MTDTGNRPDTFSASKNDIARPRRLRHSASLRAAVREIRLGAADFIYPLFIVHGKGIRRPIPSMPGIYQLSVDEAVIEARKAVDAGILATLLFGIPATKDPVGCENFADDGIIQQAIRAIKSDCPGIVVITDVCLCEYTDHGHCGLLSHEHPHLPDGYVLNDESVDILARVSLSHARAGADILAPSAMLDGMVAGIRHALDAHSFHHLPIMSYAVKYASAFYGPFRDAAQGAPKFGDRRTHQMDPANAREALKEAGIDVAEGADFLMVKPALAYLDIIHRVRAHYPQLPMVAYNTSGEYAMIKAANERGWLNERTSTLETLTAIKRAGADLIISYHALEAASWLAGEERLSP
ncbi:porphobilinogen synthase [Thioalkalivibrio sp. HK1]|uniref:porphobilinogen synthase n=1 Tax=Thioalkalivibrio sp. HK1 TaxID=1469245 RepID=UPI00047248BA|nr:porphobilinogen synthase [Thioalkalivibrio sp. HK1]